MKEIVSKQAKDIVEYLTKKGFTREKPFVPNEKTYIQEVCEIPGKYQYSYDVLLLSLWPENNNLYAVIDQVIDDKEEGMPKEMIILDNEPEDEDWENGFGEYEGPEMWYWDLNSLTVLFFKTESWYSARYRTKPCLYIPFEGDFFSIETINGIKQIHINGTLWKSDDEWRHSEYIFLIVPLKEFIDENAKQGSDYIDFLFSEAKQGIHELDERQVSECIHHYFNGHHPEGRLHYKNITMETPDGNYFN